MIKITTVNKSLGVTFKTATYKIYAIIVLLNINLLKYSIPNIPYSGKDWWGESLANSANRP